jgi:hypothetical protein
VGLSLERGASPAGLDALGANATGGTTAPSAAAAGKRGFSFSGGVSSLMAVIDPNSSPHEIKKIPSRSNWA